MVSQGPGSTLHQRRNVDRYRYRNRFRYRSSCSVPVFDSDPDSDCDSDGKHLSPVFSGSTRPPENAEAQSPSTPPPAQRRRAENRISSTEPVESKKTRCAAHFRCPTLSFSLRLRASASLFRDLRSLSGGSVSGRRLDITLWQPHQWRHGLRGSRSLLEHSRRRAGGV